MLICILVKADGGFSLENDKNYKEAAVEKKTIYEAHYFHPVHVQTGSMEKELVQQLFQTFDNISFEAFLNFTEHIKYIPLQDKNKKSFIEAAIRASKANNIDVVIRDCEYCVTVTYYLTCCGGVRGLDQFFGMTDEFSFFRDIKGWDIVICMDYYTSAVVCNGKQIAP